MYSYPNIDYRDLADHHDKDTWVAWQGLELQEHSINAYHYTPTQFNGAAAYSFQNIPSSSPNTTNTTSPYFLPIPPGANVFPSSSLEGSTEPYTYGLPIVSDGPSHPPPSVPNASAPALPPMTISTIIPSSMPSLMTAPSTSQVQRRFACATCPKTFSSQSRADTCLFNHMNIKPFACNGDCGLVGW
jgi:hypothetical protein